MYATIIENGVLDFFFNVALLDAHTCIYNIYHIQCMLVFKHFFLHCTANRSMLICNLCCQFKKVKNNKIKKKTNGKRKRNYCLSSKSMNELFSNLMQTGTNKNHSTFPKMFTNP